MSHVVAINSEGKLLWSREMASTKQGESVVAIGFARSPRGPQACIVIGIKRPGKDGETVWLRRSDGTTAFSLDGDIVE